MGQSRLKAQQIGITEMIATAWTFQATCDFYFVSTEEARKDAAQAAATVVDRGTRSLLAGIWATLGENERGEKLVQELERAYPKDTLINQAFAPTTRAILAANRKQPAEAIAQMEKVRPYEFGGPPNGTGLWPTFVRAEVYRQMQDWNKAIAEYQRVLDHRGVDTLSIHLPLAQLGMARSYAGQGDVAKARTAYQDLLAFWKDADPNAPVVKQTKAEYAKLK
jgi:tetratricopeptide (TPR) repeat protein